MKKLFYILGILGSLFVFACNDNSEEVYEELAPVNNEIQDHQSTTPVDFDNRDRGRIN